MAQTIDRPGWQNNLMRINVNGIKLSTPMTKKKTSHDLPPFVHI